MSKGIVVNGIWTSGAKLNNEWKQQSLHHDFKLTHKHRLYVAMGCPFAHSVVIALNLLKVSIPITYVETVFGPEGWYFSEEKPEPLYGFQHLHQLYTKAESRYTGRVTVPVLYDESDEKIVSNESFEIIQLLWDTYGENSKLKLFPDHPDYEKLKEKILKNVNIGVYLAAFADSQQSYEAAFDVFFNTLEELNTRLTHQKFLFGNEISALDIRLFVSLLRFEVAYHSLFKLNKFPLSHYTNLWNFVCDIHALEEVKDTIHVEQIKAAYWKDFIALNPSQLIPKGPEINFKRI